MSDSLWPLYCSAPRFLCPCVGGVCNFLSSATSQQKFEATDGPVLQSSDWPVLKLLDWPLSELRVTAQFYLESKGKFILEEWGKANPKRCKKRGLQPNFGFSFYMFFLLPLGLPYVNWASQECCSFYLRSSLQSSDLPLFYFCGFSPSLSFSHHHFVVGFFFFFLATTTLDFLIPF